MAGVTIRCDRHAGESNRVSAANTARSAQDSRGLLMGLPSFCTVDLGGERLVCLSYQDLGERAPLPGPGEGLMPRRVLSLEDWFISTA